MNSRVSRVLVVFLPVLAGFAAWGCDGPASRAAKPALDKTQAGLIMATGTEDTSCPRLTAVWDDAIAQQMVERCRQRNIPLTVNRYVSPAGGHSW